MTTVSLARAAVVHAPRGAEWAAQLWMAVQNVFERHAAKRARQAAARSVQREALEVRELAFSLRHQDPRMAADLMAAADRHERVAGLSR
jgi:hypothetical protein